MYDILEMIYREFYDMFSFDSFHMGDSHFAPQCWNSSSQITNFMENDVRLKDRDKQGMEIHKFTIEIRFEILIKISKKFHQFLFHLHHRSLIG